MADKAAQLEACKDAADVRGTDLYSDLITLGPKAFELTVIAGLYQATADCCHQG